MAVASTRAAVAGCVRLPGSPQAAAGAAPAPPGVPAGAVGGPGIVCRLEGAAAGRNGAEVGALSPFYRGVFLLPARGGLRYRPGATCSWAAVVEEGGKWRVQGVSSRSPEVEQLLRDLLGVGGGGIVFSSGFQENTPKQVSYLAQNRMV